MVQDLIIIGLVQAIKLEATKILNHKGSKEREEMKGDRELLR